jgi:hypothetical protein
MGEQYYHNFQNTEEDYPPLYPTVVPPRVHAHGGEPLDRQLSNASSVSEMSTSSSNGLSSMPPSPDTMYSPKFEFNPLNTQPYDLSLPGCYSQSENVTYTPSSLGWTYGTELLRLYTFVVPKGQEPYLELLENRVPTYETPFRVFLDQPK